MCMIAMISPGMSSCEHSINTLRYADRVKELAPSNDALIEVPEDKGKMGWNTSKNESDTEEEDVSIASRAPDVAGHQDISPSCRKSNKMQYLEQEMVSAFQLWTTLCPKFDERESQLLLEAHKLEYDPEHFSSELDRILSERQKFLSALRDRVTAFRLQMDSEEELNKENYKRCRL
uniref:Kinesin-like protein KIF2C n=1 Tax=Lygus hesperus TaxID=30085 RepID=A0A146LE25_LYGHE